MIINIIHLPERTDREIMLQKEWRDLDVECRIWLGIMDSSSITRGIAQAHKQIVQYALLTLKTLNNAIS